MIKPIPFEFGTEKKSKQKKLERTPDAHFFESVGLTLMSFFKRGGAFTAEQVGELIESMQRLIIRLHKKKMKLLSEKNQKIEEDKKAVKFRKKRIQ